MYRSPLLNHNQTKTNHQTISNAKDFDKSSQNLVNQEVPESKYLRKHYKELNNESPFTISPNSKDCLASLNNTYHNESSNHLNILQQNKEILQTYSNTDNRTNNYHSSSRQNICRVTNSNYEVKARQNITFRNCIDFNKTNSLSYSPYSHDNSFLSKNLVPENHESFHMKYPKFSSNNKICNYYDYNIENNEHLNRQTNFPREESYKYVNHLINLHGYEPNKHKCTPIKSDNFAHSPEFSDLNTNYNYNMISNPQQKELKFSENIKNNNMLHSMNMNETNNRNNNISYEKMIENIAKNRINKDYNYPNERGPQNFSPYFKITTNHIGFIEKNKESPQIATYRHLPCKNDQFANPVFQEKSSCKEIDNNTSRKKEIEYKGYSTNYRYNMLIENSNQNANYKDQYCLHTDRRSSMDLSSRKFRGNEKQDFSDKSFQKEIKVIKIEKDWKNLAELYRDI